MSSSRACSLPRATGWPTRDARFRLVPSGAPARARRRALATLSAAGADRPRAAGVSAATSPSCRACTRRRRSSSHGVCREAPVKIVHRHPGRLARGDAALRLAAAPAPEPARRRPRAHSPSAVPTPSGRSRRRRPLSCVGYGREPVATFAPFVDVERLRCAPPVPLPDRRRRSTSAALERIKGFDTLAEAWRIVASRVPDARAAARRRRQARRARRGAGAERFPGRVEWQRLLPADEVARAIDASWLLVLPSRSEGLGRVLLEAACRGRALVGTTAAASRMSSGRR